MSVAAPVRHDRLRISGIAAFIAIAGIGGIAANRHWTGNTEWINLGWTAVFAFGALGIAGLTAQAAFKALGNGFANVAFILAMLLASSGMVLYKGPAHNFAVTRLQTLWPAGAALLARTDPAGPTPHGESKPIKGDPQVRVYRKGESAHAPE